MTSTFKGAVTLRRVGKSVLNLLKNCNKSVKLSKYGNVLVKEMYTSCVERVCNLQRMSNVLEACSQPVKTCRVQKIIFIRIANLL